MYVGLSSCVFGTCGHITHMYLGHSSYVCGTWLILLRAQQLIASHCNALQHTLQHTATGMWANEKLQVLPRVLLLNTRQHLQLMCVYWVYIYMCVCIYMDIYMYFLELC